MEQQKRVIISTDSQTIVFDKTDIAFYKSDDSENTLIYKTSDEYDVDPRSPKVYLGKELFPVYSKKYAKTFNETMKILGNVK